MQGGTLNREGHVQEVQRYIIVSNLFRTVKYIIYLIRGLSMYVAV